MLRRAKGRLLEAVGSCIADDDLIDLCMSFDEFSDKEKTAEILPISVQQLYVFSLLGKAKDADDLVSTLSTQEYFGLTIPIRVCAY